MNTIVQKTLTLLSISLAILISIKFSKRKLSISLKEKEQGYIIYKHLGLKFRLPDLWRDHSKNLIIEDLVDTLDNDNLIYGGKKYSFAFHEIIIDLFSIIVFRENKLTPETELPQITGTYYNKNISNISGYSFYFCINGFDDDMKLPEEAKVIYKAMYDDIDNIKASITTYKPMTS